jgi:hypothetical protein
MVMWLVNALMSPLLKIGEKYLENEGDKQKLQHGSDRVAIEADASIRKIKLTYWMGRLPLFIAEASCALYIAAIFIDSTWASDYINPLKLPVWFEDDFSVIVASLFGLAAAKTLMSRK